MTTERAAVREASRRLSVKDGTKRERERARGGPPEVLCPYAPAGAAEDDKGKARRRSLRWMELGWQGTTTAAREEARNQAVLEMLRERRDQEAERLKRLRAEVQVPHEVARL